MANTFNNATISSVTTSMTDMYQAPASSGAVSIVLSVLAANVNGSSSADFTLAVTDSSNTILSYIAFTIPVPADTTLECVSNKVVLKAGQKLRALASSSSFFNVTVSALEIT